MKYANLSFVVLLSILMCQIITATAQTENKYPLSDFRQPLDISPPALAGSFGELRANHFHSGLDFRTNQRQGYPVYAVSDGYISRLRVQNSGFGLSLYINHPNGYTTVYGHLQRFAPKIARIVLDLQYKNSSYELDQFPAMQSIPVKKGEIIAWSGNSGSSGGPHLHFEIRNTKTEVTINPQLFGIRIPDQVPPVIQSMYVYRLNKQAFDEDIPKQYFQVAGANGKYHLNKVNVVHLHGEVGFGIVTNDRHTGLSGLNGVYSITLEVNGNPVFKSMVDQFSFENSRGINSHIDYPTYIKSKTSIQKSFKDPGNPLKIYHDLVNDGRVEINDGQVYDVKYIVKDFAGNESILAFKVIGDRDANIPEKTKPAGVPFAYNAANEFTANGLKIVIPKGSLYNDLSFQYSVSAAMTKKAFSPIHHIHKTTTPLHSGFDLWIQPDSNLLKWKEKSLIVNTAGQSQGGFFEAGYVKASPRVFGNFYVAIDTVPPVIVAVNIGPNKNMAGVGRINLRIADALSGIKKYQGYIDGKWVLMEFDAKTASIWHTFDQKTQPGKHTFELIVEDMKANTKKYLVTFIR